MPAPPANPPLLPTHAGSSLAAIAAEPDWGKTTATSHEHRTGFVNGAGRRAGWTHDGDDHDEDDEFVADAMRKQRDLRARARSGDLISFVDVMRAQTVSGSVRWGRGRWRVFARPLGPLCPEA